ncbi:MAG: AbrB/MazE/SpoVT family DNA-binding domain-containing protein [Candidatus Hodarchaeales archaeon]|jgi:bifunctional DNA-binding transcriptional regulator/antitoxin component of YhaV-PrlF toxin-antitoxin module
MTTLEWTGRVGKGSSTGAGWITLPAKLREGMTLGEYYDLTIMLDGQDSIYLNKNLKKVKKSWGFYLPKALCTERGLTGQKVKIILERTEYFPVKVNLDKRVRLPKSVVEKNGIEEGDIYEVELEVDGESIREMVIIITIDRSKDPNRADEYYFTVRMNAIPTSTKARVKILRKIEKILPTGEQGTGKTIYLANFFPKAIIGRVDERSMIIFQGNHVPIITPVQVDMNDLIHYFGLYYADGTKVGPGWSTGASTPEQAIYSIKKYESLILNGKLVYNVTFTGELDSEVKIGNIKRELKQSWKRQANIELESDKIYLRESVINKENEERDLYRKHNPIGSLRIRDNRGLVLELHRRFLEIIQSLILTTEYINLFWQFLFGIMEGDGSVGGGTDRCRLVITCNKSDKIIPYLLNKVGIKQLLGTNKYSEQSPNTMDYSFGLIPILKNLSILQKHLFFYYPKRRKLFIKKLLNTASVRYLLGEIDQLFPLALHPLRENKITCDNYIVELLIKLRNELLQT